MISIRNKQLLVTWFIITLLLIGACAWNYFLIESQFSELISLSPDVRESLSLSIIKSEVLTFGIFWVLLLLVTGLIIHVSHRKIFRFTDAISKYNPDSLKPIECDKLPDEVKPLGAQINHLFQRLEETFAREKRFTADAAHELRTPLSALKIQAQVALNAQDNKERENALKNIIASVDRCSRLIEQLSLLSLIDSEKIKDKFSLVDLKQIAADVVEHLQYAAENKHITLNTQLPPSPTYITGNAIAIEVLLRNIIDNAIRYSPEHTTVKISVTSSSHTHRIDIEDNGPGIPIELRERIFERFFRGPQTTVPGSGLGLAIVDQIATLHNASIELTTPKTHSGLNFALIFNKH